MFEHYVATYPTASREVCDGVDLIFMNQAEYDGLYGDAQLPVPKAPLIVKRGSSGARLIVDGHPQEVEAGQIRVVDPTGGGEILAGVFLALRAGGQPEREALKYAVRAAASCVARLRRHRLAPDRGTRGHPPRGHGRRGIQSRLIALHPRRRSSPPLRGRAARRSPCEQFG